VNKLFAIIPFIILFTGIYSQEVSGSMIFNRGVNASFNLYTLNTIQYGITRNDYTVIDLNFRDLPGGNTYTGFALYIQALQPQLTGTTTNIPLNKIKFTCSGTEVANVFYVTDTSVLESKLSSAMQPICYWETTEGIARTDQVKLTYYIEPLMGYESDNYFVEVDFVLRSYTGTP
jgi:hypothetical protein